MTHQTANHFATHAAIRSRRPFSYWTPGRVTPFLRKVSKPVNVHTGPTGRVNTGGHTR